jgi:hypothetical protein
MYFLYPRPANSPPAGPSIGGTHPAGAPVVRQR